jgi:hypothetical protein
LSATRLTEDVWLRWLESGSSHRRRRALTTTQHPIQTLKFLLLNQVLESRLRMARMRYDQYSVSSAWKQRSRAHATARAWYAALPRDWRAGDH